MTHDMTIADQPTCPLPTEAMALRSALRHHHLSLLQLARASGMRYVTAWRAAQGLPIRPEHTSLLRATLARLTVYASSTHVRGTVPEQTHRDGRRERRGA